MKEITIEQAFKNYSETKKKRPIHSTIKSMGNKLPEYLDVKQPLSSLTTGALHRLVHQRSAEGISNQTNKHWMMFMRGTLNLARVFEYDVPDVEIPKIKVENCETRYLTKDEIDRLLVALKPVNNRQAAQDNYDLVVLLLNFGARHQEIAHLPWKHVNFTERTVSIWRSKVGNGSTLPMTKMVYDVLKRRWDNRLSDQWVFTNQSGGRRNYSSKGIRTAIKRAGLTGVTMRTLRHTAASIWVQNGMSLAEIQNMLGHTSPVMSMRYSHLIQTEVGNKAANVMNSFLED